MSSSNFDLENCSNGTSCRVSFGKKSRTGSEQNDDLKSSQTVYSESSRMISEIQSFPELCRSDNVFAVFRVFTAKQLRSKRIADANFPMAKTRDEKQIQSLLKIKVEKT